MKKQWMAGILILAMIMSLGYILLNGPGLSLPDQKQEPAVYARTREKEIQVLENGQWTALEIKGVNMGSGIPGVFPNDGGISRETYARWFQMIGDMNANTIRVYQLQVPDFYTALAQYNETHEKPLYLIQTMDFPDRYMYSEQNFLDPAVSRELFRETRDTVDALHGRKIRLDAKHSRLDLYTADVSRYVLGYLLGIEWDEVFVSFQDRMNPNVRGYRGTFLTSTPDSTPFETFLAQWGDDLLRYEAEQYSAQKLISFCNWPDTDPFVNEFRFQSGSDGESDLNTEVQVDQESILPTSLLQSGTFASYNVYPYYPLFLQYGPYTCYKDDTGHPNPYRKYLSDLAAHHSCPVIISEYGLPSSRNKAHEDIWRGFTHGGLNEARQADAIKAMLQDIRMSGCAGSLAFSWQDEWYKRAWNEERISDPDGRASWSNAVCSEQAFGLMAFEPGKSPEHTGYPDGDISEWSEISPVLHQDGMSLKLRTDARYVHFLVDGYDPKTGVSIVLDTLPDAGITEIPGHTFSRGAEFLLNVSPEEGACLMVHDDYNLLVYSMSDKMNSGITNEAVNSLSQQYPDGWITTEPSSRFQVVRRVSGSIYSYLRHMLDVDPVGNLQMGNGNPASPDYDSNADYMILDNRLEIRIPWQMLNFRDPSRCQIVDRISRENRSIRSLQIRTVYAGLFTENQPENVEFAPYSLQGWKKPQYHERLKDVYYVLQDAFRGVQ